MINFADAYNLLAHLGRNSVFINGEENTKRVLIEPVIERILGYKIPNDVELEHLADIGIKGNEKVDYAIKINGKVELLIEAKDIGVTINTEHISQLYRYYAALNASIGIITNGVEWWLFSDTERKNIMDTKPYAVIDIRKFSEVDYTKLMDIGKENLTLTLNGEVKDKLVKDEQKSDNILSDYEISRKMHTFIHSEEFLGYLGQACGMEGKTNAEISDMLRSVVTGEAVIKYKKPDNSGSVSLINIDLPLMLQRGIRSIEITDIHTGKFERKIDNWKDLIRVCTEYCWTKNTDTTYNAIMNKLCSKKWVSISNSDAIQLGCITVHGYAIDTSCTLKEILNRTLTILKAFGVEPMNITILLQQ